MKLAKAGKILLFIFIPGMLAGQDIVKDGRYFKTTLVKAFAVQPDGQLVIKRAKGDVTITAWAQAKVEIREEIRMDVITKAEAQRLVDQAEASYSQRGNAVMYDGRRGRRHARHTFRIQVPRAFDLDISAEGSDVSAEGIRGKLELRTSAGDLTIRETGGRLRAHTSGGDIELADHDGDVEITTSGGKIRLAGVSGPVRATTSGGDLIIEDTAAELNARTSGGNVRASNLRGKSRLSTSGGNITLAGIQAETRARTSGGDITGRDMTAELEVSTSGGDIELYDLQGPADAATSGGDVRVEMTLADFSRPHWLALSSTGGDIELTLPAKLPAKIIAEIRLDPRRRSFRRRDIYSDFPITKTEATDGNRRVLRGEAELNGGGDAISLETTGGNIRIRKGK